MRLVREVIACANARFGVAPMTGVVACARRIAALRCPPDPGPFALVAEVARCVIARVGVAPLGGVVACARKRLAKS